jgi:hypothetical protein
MKKLLNYLRANLSFTIGIVMLMAVGFYIGYRQIMLTKHGVITIARVDKFESAEQGINLYITVYFRNKQYNSMIDAACYGCEGKYFFIKIDSTSPQSGGKLYKDKIVPSCVFSNKVPLNGWNEIPNNLCN